MHLSHKKSSVEAELVSWKQEEKLKLGRVPRIIWYSFLDKKEEEEKNDKINSNSNRIVLQHSPSLEEKLVLKFVEKGKSMNQQENTQKFYQCHILNKCSPLYS